MIEAEGGGGHVIEADVTREAACRSLVDESETAYGHIDVLHNNIGIGRGDSGITSMSEEAWDRIFATNLKSIMFLTKYAIPGMRERQSGVITNISSVAAVCSVGIVAYKTSKAALNAYTHAVASANWRHGIRAMAQPTPTCAR